MKDFTVLITFFLCFTSPLFAQKLILHEEGFTLKPEERQKLELLARYEAQLYDELFDTESNDTLSIVVNIYKKKKDYENTATTPGGPLSSTGFYDVRRNQCFIYKHSDFINTTVHEMGHAFMHHNLIHPAKWLNEGISEFFESLAIEKGKVVVSEQSGRLTKVSRDLASNSFNFKDFVTQSDGNWMEKDKQADMYNISYSIVYYIMKTNPDNLKKLALASRGKSSLAAIRSVFGSLNAFEAGYNSFYRKF